MQKLNSAFRLALLCAPVALIACQAMPTGYTYHNEVYKAPPGPEATPPAKILETRTTAETTNLHTQGTLTSTLSESEQRAAMGGVYGDEGDPEAFRAVADDLIGRMIVNFGRPMEPVFVNQSSPMTASLKASMRRHEIPVAVNPGDGPFVIDHSIEGANATIVFFSNHERVTSESGSYPAAVR